MAPYSLLPVSDIRKLLSYDPETGTFTWRTRTADMLASRSMTQKYVDRFNSQKAGRAALNKKRGGGYVGGAIFERGYLAHRVAWAVTHGEWPDYVDHINHNRSDNRLVNLRAVTASENMRNQARRRSHKSGYFGVYRCSKRGTWNAQIYDNGAPIFLGAYLTMDEAVAARKAGEIILGYHENHGS